MQELLSHFTLLTELQDTIHHSWIFFYPMLNETNPCLIIL